MQINNWNEQRKNITFEKEILEQIGANLIKDKLTLKGIQANFKNAMTSTDKVLNATWTQEEKDSVKYWLGDIIQFDRFQPLTNAYEVAKSKGLDLISNKQLRFIIGTYYDDELKNVMKSIEDIERAFQRDWVSILKKEAQEVKFKQYIVLKDIVILEGNTEAVSILRINKNNFNGGFERMKRVINRIDHILNLINVELQ